MPDFRTHHSIFTRAVYAPASPSSKPLSDHLFAHELQHALEVLSDRSVRTAGEIFGLFQRIGVWRGHSFETHAAIRVGEDVRSELRRPRGGRSQVRAGSDVTSFPPESSRANQALANRESRITVSGATFRTTAVSSTVKPPKKRSSMT